MLIKLSLRGDRNLKLWKTRLLNYNEHIRFGARLKLDKFYTSIYGVGTSI